MIFKKYLLLLVLGYIKADVLLPITVNPDNLTDTAVNKIKSVEKSTERDITFNQIEEHVSISKPNETTKLNNRPVEANVGNTVNSRDVELQPTINHRNSTEEETPATEVTLLSKAQQNKTTPMNDGHSVYEHSAVLEVSNDTFGAGNNSAVQLDEESVNGSKSVGDILQTFDSVAAHSCNLVEETKWQYLKDVTNTSVKTSMMFFSDEYDKIKKSSWEQIQMANQSILDLPKRVVKQLQILKKMNAYSMRSTDRMSISVSAMQDMWYFAKVCPYTKMWKNESTSNCNLTQTGMSVKGIEDIMKTSRDYDEQIYYWKAWRNATGSQIRTQFLTYVSESHEMAKANQFRDMGEMWRSLYDDDKFKDNVEDLWTAISPLYNLLHSYVRRKLVTFYKEEFKADKDMIPAHVLGTIWAQDWSNIFDIVIPFPGEKQLNINGVLGKEKSSVETIFDFANDYYESMGLNNMSNYYKTNSVVTNNEYPNMDCQPATHDMCLKKDFRINMCGKVDLDTLRLATHQLGHIQYYIQYSDQPLLFRKGPIPAFPEALADVAALQVLHPSMLSLTSTYDHSNITEGQKINHIMKTALYKLPMIAFSYTLDKWRWDIFSETVNIDSLMWNDHWWKFRKSYMKLEPPVDRTSIDLDPASKYHVVANYEHIKYFIAYILEFQILKALCNTTGQNNPNNVSSDQPLHLCHLKGSTQAGEILRKGMELGASENWHTVLETMTGERNLSPEPFLEYFRPLQEFLQKDAESYEQVTEEDMDISVPIVIGMLILLLLMAMILVYIIKKRQIGAEIVACISCNIKESHDIKNDGTVRAVNRLKDEIADERL